MSFLPGARSGSPDTPVTVFGTVINSGEVDLECAPRFGGFMGGLPAGVTGQFRFFAWDGTTITGAANEAVVIPAGGRQDYVVEAEFDAAFAGRVAVNFRCDDGADGVFDAPSLTFVNHITYTIRDTAGPDIVMIGDTLSGDGVARVGETGPRAALLTVAAINIGETADRLDVSAGLTGFLGLNENLAITVCETDALGACLTERARTITISDWANGETRFFAARAVAPPGLGLPFYPDILRLTVAVRVASDPAGVQGGAGAVSGDGNGRAASGHRAGFLVRDEWADDFVFDAAAAAAVAAELKLEHGLTYGVGDPPQTFECRSRLDGDMSGVSTQGFGALAVAPDGESGFRALGYLGLRDFNETDYLQPIQVDSLNWRDSPNFSVTAFGTGEADEVFGDTPFGATGDFQPNVSIRLRWNADGLFNNDFQSDGRTRCAPVPAPADEYARDQGLAPYDGDYEFGEALGAAATMTIGDNQVRMRDVGPGDTVQAYDGEIAGEGGETPPDPASVVFANMVELAILNVLHGEIFFGASAESPEGDRKPCGVVVTPDAPGGAGGASDADVEDFTPQFPEDLGDSECIL